MQGWSDFMQESPDIEFATTFWSKVKGLMFKKDYNKILVFVFSKPTKTSFHTFFMRFAIDIYFFLNGMLVDKRINVKPWKIIKPRAKYDMVIEVKHGLISEEKILELALSLKSRKEV